MKIQQKVKIQNLWTRESDSENIQTNSKALKLVWKTIYLTNLPWIIFFNLLLNIWNGPSKKGYMKSGPSNIIVYKVFAKHSLICPIFYL